MITLKPLLLEYMSAEEYEKYRQTDEYKKWRSDWLNRHKAKFSSDGRIIAYHSTPTKNVKNIKQNGFKENSYFSLDKDYSQQIVKNYHNVNKIVTFEVKLPLDAIDFSSSDIFSIRTIKFDETI